MQNKILSMISLATKAGRLKGGGFAAEEAVKNDKAFLVIAATDASENTIKHFRDISSWRNIPFYLYGTKDELGRCTGKDSRAVVALTDEGFGNSLISMLKEEDK